MKSGNLNFLEPSGPLEACNGTVLPLYIYIYIKLDRKISKDESCLEMKGLMENITIALEMY